MYQPRRSAYFEQFNLELSEIIIAKNTMKLLKKLPNGFSNQIIYLIKNSGLTMEEISGEIFLTDRYLRKWKTDNKNKLNVSAVAILKFCVGLNLPPAVCNLLLLSKGKKFNKESGIIYEAIRDKYYSKDIEIINEVLRQANLRIWEEKY